MPPRRSPRLLAKQQKLATKPFDLRSYSIIQPEVASGGPVVSNPKMDMPPKEPLKRQTAEGSPASCRVPDNQYIYEALFKKAFTYPFDQPYKSAAYIKAAISVLKYKHSIPSLYSEFSDRPWLAHIAFTHNKIPNVGPSIFNFIINTIDPSAHSRIDDFWKSLSIYYSQ
jgi:hypothetical protein